MAVVEASSCSSDLTPSLGTPICHEWSPKKPKKKKKRNNDTLGNCIVSSNSAYELVNPILQMRNKGFVYLFIFFFLEPHLRHMDVPRVGVKLELQLPATATATATAMPDP